MMRLMPGALAVALTIALTGCSREPSVLEIPTGSDVTVERRDGVTVTGRVIEVQAREVVLEATDGRQTRVPRAEITSVRATSLAENAAAPARSDSAAAAPTSSPSGRVNGSRGEQSPAGDRPSTVEAAGKRAAKYREVTIPSGTVLPVALLSAVSSESSKLEDPVRGRVRRAVTIDGVEAIPEGSAVLGTVTDATRPGRVKGRARVALRFTSLDLPGDPERLAIRTGTVARQAEGTGKEDAAKIGGAAAGGAIIGGLLGGGDGAAKGAAIGGAAGTGAVLSTRGKDVSLNPGENLSVRLTAPVTVRVRVE